MEETSRCNITQDVRPQDRIHLHDHLGHLVHVHMAASTWGDLFANLLWGIGPNFLADDLGNIHLPDHTNQLLYILNGEKIDNPANITVKSEDRLLVWYGT
jgi:hypothetical protein